MLCGKKGLSKCLVTYLDAEVSHYLLYIGGYNVLFHKYSFVMGSYACKEVYVAYLLHSEMLVPIMILHQKDLHSTVLTYRREALNTLCMTV